MGRTRNEISTKNKYYISKHRYLELKHFCLQYPEWKRALSYIENLPPSKSIVEIRDVSSGGSFLEETAGKRIELTLRLELIERIAAKTDDYLGRYVFKAVTQGSSYECLHASGMACCKDMFYDRYHKFFWLLDQAR